MTHRVLLAAAVTACSLLAAPHAAGAISNDEAGAVLAKHKAYVGWAYGDGTLKSARTTVVSERPPDAPTPRPDATPDPFGPANLTTVELRRELLYKDASSAYGVETDASGFTGAVFWRSNENGLTVTRRGRDAQQALTEDVIEAEAFSEAPVTARPDAQFDGKKAAVLRVQPKTAVPADVFFDRETGAMLGFTVQPDVPLERLTVHVVSYGEFAPGKRYVASYRVGTSKRLFVVKKFEPNVPVSDADLHPPAPRATWTFGEPHSIPIAIVSHGGRYSDSGGRAVHFEASINGHPGHFLLDSGADGTLIYGRFAKAAGLKRFGRTSYSGVNGRGVAATLARADSMTIGGNTLHNVIVTETGSEDAASRGGLDGIIGFDALAGAVFDVDLTKNRLTVSDPATYPMEEPKQGAWAFTPDLSEFHIGTPVKVGNNVLSRVWLDTGDDFFVILPHELEKTNYALVNEITLKNNMTIEQRVTFGGVDGAGAEQANCARLNEIQIGPYRYQKAVSCFAPNDAFGLDGGLIGFDFLRHFNWTFDYPHSRVVLTPNGQ